jgi:PAS domain S-box-containing protein
VKLHESAEAEPPRAGVFARMRSRWRDLPLRRKDLAVMAVPLLALAIGLVAGYVERSAHREAQLAAQQIYAIRMEIRPILDAVTKAEAAIRGYQLTGHQEFMESFNQARAEAVQNLSRVSDLLAGRPLDSARVEKAWQLTRESTEMLLGQLKSTKPRQQPTSAEIEQTLQGKHVMDNLRTEILGLDEAQQARIEERAGALDALDRQIGWWLLLSVVLALIGLIAAAQLGAGVSRRLHTLRADASSLARGRVLPARERSKDELGELESALQGASTLLDQQRRALLKNQQLLQGIIEGTSDMVYALDLDRRFLLVNGALARMFGKRPEDMLGLHIGEVFLPEAVWVTEQSNAHVLENAGMQTFEEPMPLQGRTVTLLVTKGILKGQGDEAVGIVAIARDISRRIKMEAWLASSQAEAEKARAEAVRANEAKSEFLSRMSHELRTPLNSILGFSQLLEMEGLTTEQKESNKQIAAAGQHLLNLINEVLDIARVEAGHMSISPEPVSIPVVMEECLSLLRPLAKRHGIVLHAPPPEECGCFVKADRNRLRQVLLNFLSNAVKYNRPCGEVRLACGAQLHGRARIEVRDSGYGIAASDLARLFTPFERLSGTQDIEGTGLGLALAKRLVELMGGEVGASSVVGEGSVFWLELPQTAAPLSAVPEPMAPLPATKSGEKGLVLYIEDNCSNINLVERILSHRPNLKLLSAMQGQLGFDLALQHRPDAILLDLNLPDVPGQEVLRRLRGAGETRDTPVIILSADATKGAIQRLVAAGADAFLTKPLNLKEFLVEVDRAIDTTARRQARPAA